MLRKHGLQDLPIIMDARSGTRERSLYLDKNRKIRVVFVSEAVKLDVGEGTNVMGAVRCHRTHDCVFQHHWRKSSASKAVLTRANEIKRHKSGDASSTKFVFWRI